MGWVLCVYAVGVRFGWTPVGVMVLGPLPVEGEKADLPSKEIDNDAAFAIGFVLATNTTLVTLSLGYNRIEHFH